MAHHCCVQTMLRGNKCVALPILSGKCLPGKGGSLKSDQIHMPGDKSRGKMGSQFPLVFPITAGFLPVWRSSLFHSPGYPFVLRLLHRDFTLLKDDNVGNYIYFRSALLNFISKLEVNCSRCSCVRRKPPSLYPFIALSLLSLSIYIVPSLSLSHFTDIQIHAHMRI